MSSSKMDDKLEPMWQELKEGLENIYFNSISKSDYLRLYTLVYDFCSLSSKSTSSNNQLHKYLATFLSENIQKIHKKCKDLIDEPLLFLYCTLWRDYRFSSKVLGGVCAYLNRQWVRRERAKSRRIDVLEAYPLALKMWKEDLMEQLKSRMSRALLNMIKRERSGETVNTRLLSTTLDSYIEMGINNGDLFSEHPNLYFYKEAFEVAFLAETESYYATESAIFIRENPVSEFLKKVEIWIEEEKKRVQLYLHDTTLEVLMKILNHFVIIKYLDTFQAEFKIFLERNRAEDLKIMCRILSRVPQGLDKLRSQFGEYVTSEGMSEIERLESDINDHKPYIHAILNVHQRFNNILMTSFTNEPGFVAAFDKACEKFINKNSLTESRGSSNKSAEFLARHFDFLLKKKSTDSEEIEIVDELNRAMVIFKYIEEKDMFESYYSKLLAKRIVQQMNITNNDDIENSMISKMRDICGFEYAAKLQRMVQDVCISRDLNEQFKTEVESLNLDFSICVISSSSWPFSHSQSMSLPHELEQSVQKFTDFYNSRFNGRKLTWLYSNSKGELYSTCFDKRYTFQSSTFQITVLLQFNNETSLSFRQLVETTGLESVTLKQVLQILIKSKLLKEVQDDAITETSTFALNESYQNKRLKVNINVHLKTQLKSEQDTIDKHVQDTRKFIIQAAIVRIAKSRKIVQHQVLLMEVINQLSSKFKPHIPDIKKCIELLIAKEYLKRDENDSYSYIA